MLAIREAVVSAARALARDGFVIGTAGNVSARDGERVAITPTGVDLSAVRPGDVTIVDLAGQVIDGRWSPSWELGLHLGIYQNAQAGAVAHSHPPITTALSCVLDELPCIHLDMLELGGAVRVAPYRAFGTAELVEATLAALARRRAALMSNHGAVVLGDDPGHAVRQTRLLEWVSQLYWRAALLGVPRTLDDQQQAAVREAIDRIGYGTPRPLDSSPPRPLDSWPP